MREFAPWYPGYSGSTGNQKCLRDLLTPKGEVPKSKTCISEVRRAGNVSSLIVIPAALPFYFLMGAYELTASYAMGKQHRSA